MKYASVGLIWAFLIEAVIGFVVNEHTSIAIYRWELYLFMTVIPMALVLTANLLAARKGSIAGIAGAALVDLGLLLSILSLPWKLVTEPSYVIADLAVLFGIASIFRILTVRILPKVKPYYGWWFGFLIAFIPALIVEVNLASLGKGYVSLFQVLGFMIVVTLSGGYT